MKHPEKEFPNPFAEADSYRDKLDQCETTIAEMKEDIRLLRQCAIMLMNLCNRKLANEKEKAPR